LQIDLPSTVQPWAGAPRYQLLMSAMDFLCPGIARRRAPPVARLSWWLLAFNSIQLFILRRLASGSFASFLHSVLSPILRLSIFPISSFHFFALLPEDLLLELQQRDLLFLQHAHHIKEGPQGPSDHSLILLIQIALLDFVDQSLDFGGIDFRDLVVRFS